MAQTLARIILHVVFSTKEREKIITDKMAERLYPYMINVCNNIRSHVYQIGGMEDHVHLLLELSRTMSVAEALRVIKANSSRWIRSEFPECRDFHWQSGYGVFSVGQASLDGVMDYIANQKVHHATRDFKEEFLIFLNRAKIQYDDKYCWV